MENNSACNICNELASNLEAITDETYRTLVLNKQNILLETKNYCVIPSYGPLHSSHVMIVTKAHKNNFALVDLVENQELFTVISKLKNFYFEKFGKELIMFESGAGTHIDHSGGCIVHAHIHCVVNEPSFEPALANELKLQKVSSNEDFDIKNGYVWFLNGEGNAFYCNRPLLPSQFLRFLYLTSKNSKQRWNWRRDIDVQGINKVISTYDTLKYT